MKCRYTLPQARRAAAALGVKWSRVRYSPRDLLVGMRVEREHRDITHCSPVLSARIALAHLRERPDYYVRLKKYVER
jgi:hypothetical protein